MNKLALILLAIAAPAFAAPPANFDARVESVRQAAGVPGMAIAIVENGHTVLAKGYGERRLGSGTKVDADTLFLIGSTTKAITTAALATLVDSGKLGWDDRVVDRLPGFQMYDPWVTREMTVRDLLVHRSGLGLGAGDLLYIPRGSLSRAEVVRRLRYLKPSGSFRDRYAYDNILYIVAGQLIEAVSGQSWEDYVREHVLVPAGMTRATTDEAHRLADFNRAQPHARFGGPVRGTGEQRLLDERDQLAPASAPAGLIALSANDMAKWLTLQLAHGALPGGGRLFSEASSKEMWSPVTPEPIAAPPTAIAGTAPQFQAYALGWEVRDYHGAKIVWHAGGLFGFTSVVVLIPEKQVGFAIEVNSEDIQPRVGLMYELLDHYLGLPKQDWPSRFAAYRQTRIAEAEAEVRRAVATPVKAGPSLPLAAYAGLYSDPWYGHMAVAATGNKATIDFKTTPGMKGQLDHYQYDTFIARFDDRAIEPAYVTFGLGADGKVERITMKPVSPIADFSFDYGDFLFTPVGANR
ncbi:serine hydrolase [Sphingomonas sp. RB1R13]|uniref:serine hydrolase n=1 Tax=Sphingomonas sp. RB1R13 TaxID=3096159 RepID=UPI002FC91ADB